MQVQRYNSQVSRTASHNGKKRLPQFKAGLFNEMLGGGAILSVTGGLIMDSFTSRANDKRKAGLELVGCWEDRISSILSLYGIRQKIIFLQQQETLKALEDTYHVKLPKQYIPLARDAMDTEFLNAIEMQNERIALDAQLESKMNTASLVFQSLVKKPDTVHLVNALNKALRNPEITKSPVLLDAMYIQLNLAEHAVFKELGQEKGLSAIETSRSLNPEDRKKLLAANPSSYSNYVFNPLYPPYPALAHPQCFPRFQAIG